MGVGGDFSRCCEVFLNHSKQNYQEKLPYHAVGNSSYTIVDNHANK